MGPKMSVNFGRYKRDHNDLTSLTVIINLA